jgi:NAD(P)-dependent dehydrogenase (short-subunit alcohol dehydrogenase family)
MVAETVERFGRLDRAVNNAGIVNGPFFPVAEVSDEDWFATINTNLNAVFMSMKSEIPSMLASGGS